MAKGAKDFFGGEPHEYKPSKKKISGPKNEPEEVKMTDQERQKME